MKIFRIHHSLRLLAITVAGGFWFLGTTGCQPPETTMKNPGAATAHKHDDGHDHDHSHDHGPNGGHLVDLAPSQMHAEWAHDDESGKLTIFFDDLKKAGKKVEAAKVELSVAGKPPKDYEFTATDKGTFELANLELLTAIEMASGEADSKVAAKLIATVDGKEESAAIVHHDHGHSH